MRGLWKGEGGGLWNEARQKLATVKNSRFYIVIKGVNNCSIYISILDLFGIHRRLSEQVADLRSMQSSGISNSGIHERSGSAVNDTRSRANWMAARTDIFEPTSGTPAYPCDIAAAPDIDHM